ncbi:potassium/proton antiporter [Maioricimonas rarisocia]|uniref:Potassium/proton antiporter n=1 Tax=Maioricimonas rarisocia TaxID=2528026 RepID=A0A517ZF00_9PLAN|nr:TrkA C-terminal domain-containing protein [Maioricimonas rarisocia]QDU41048.1 potassium/proton antiporter [Maioricimonas rarisocia]
MTAIASLLVVLTLSLLVTRIAAMALILTGMSRESARFQARSAFTGVGYPTHEAEDIVGHPVRRRVIMLLMLLGNLGIGAVVATLILSTLQTAESEYWWMKLLALAFGLWVLWRAATNRFLERHTNRIIAWVLRRWGNLQVRDYVAILQLQGGYAVHELMVEPGDWLADRTLIELRLPQEGVLVLAVQRTEGVFLGAPTGETAIRAGDTLILYGPVERIEELDQRRRGRRGDAAHREAVEEYAEDLEQQEQIDDQIEEERRTSAPPD